MKIKVIYKQEGYEREITDKSREASRQNGKLGGRPPNTTLSEEQKAKMREAQQARREREKQARIEAEEIAPEASAEKRPVGRPRKQAAPEPDAPKRGRGRPKKTVQNPSDGAEASQTVTERQEQAE